MKQCQFQSLNEDQGKALLKRCLLRAFDYGSMEDIDLVYPKFPMKKEQIQKSITTLLSTCVMEIMTLKTAEGLDIENSFETIKEHR